MRTRNKSPRNAKEKPICSPPVVEEKLADNDDFTELKAFSTPVVDLTVIQSDPEDVEVVGEQVARKPTPLKYINTIGKLESDVEKLKQQNKTSRSELTIERKKNYAEVNKLKKEHLIERKKNDSELKKLKKDLIAQRSLREEIVYVKKELKQTMIAKEKETTAKNEETLKLFDAKFALKMERRALRETKLVVEGMKEELKSRRKEIDKLRKLNNTHDVRMARIRMEEIPHRNELVQINKDHKENNGQEQINVGNVKTENI